MPRFEPTRDPLQQVLLRERRDLFLGWLAQLGEEQRAVVTYRFVDGLSVAETAELMEKSQGAVKMLLHRALSTMTEVRERADAATIASAEEVVRHGR